MYSGPDPPVPDCYIMSLVSVFVLPGPGLVILVSAWSARVCQVATTQAPHSPLSLVILSFLSFPRQLQVLSHGLIPIAITQHRSYY